MSGSAIPAAWSALTNLWKTAVPALQVVRGLVFDPAADFLAVGWDRTDQAAIRFVPIVMGPGIGRPKHEQFEVSSLLSFSYDANSIDQVVTDMFATYRLLDTALETDPTLGGVVTHAATTAGDVTQFLTESGVALMDLRFTTQFEAVT